MRLTTAQRRAVNWAALALVAIAAFVQLGAPVVPLAWGAEAVALAWLAVRRRHRWSALAGLAGGIGDPMVRNMGTIGGSIANADPAACYPAGVLGLNARIQTDRRTIAADAFFTGLYETALQPGELIVSVTFPATQKAAYVKYKQQASRFALIGVCVAQTAAGVRVGVTGAKGHAFRATEIENALAKSFTAAAAKAVKMPTTDINADLHGSAEYRAAMISVIASRAVAAALAR